MFSELKSCSLYERLHLTAEKMPLRSRVSIGRQVAQALGYLHAKSISARCLSSRNVYLEPKVKLCVLDHGIADTACARWAKRSHSRHTLQSNKTSMPRTADKLEQRKAVSETES